MTPNYEFAPGQRVSRNDDVQIGKTLYGEVRQMKADGVVIQWENDFITNFHNRQEFALIDVHPPIKKIEPRISVWQLLLLFLVVLAVSVACIIAYSLWAAHHR